MAREQGNDPTATPEGQPGQPPPTGDQATAGEQPQPLTLEQVREIAQEEGEKSFRRAQGLVTSTNQKVRDRLQQLEDGFKAQADAGAPVDPTVQERLRNKAIAEVMQESGSPPTDSTAEPPQASGPAQKESDPVLSIVLDMQKEAGVELLEGDPEIATLDQSTPHTLIKTLGPALAAKKARISGGGTEGSEPPGQGIVPGGTMGEPVVDIGQGQGLERLQRYFRNKKQQ